MSPNTQAPEGGASAFVVVFFLGQWIFVIETKNMEGWIFGDAKSRRWTQNLYGKKLPFQNPLDQNYRHTKALEEFLGLPASHFHSVVCFVGDTCELKTEMPPNVICGGPLRKRSCPSHNQEWRESRPAVLWQQELSGVPVYASDRGRLIGRGEGSVEDRLAHAHDLGCNGPVHDTVANQLVDNGAHGAEVRRIIPL